MDHYTQKQLKAYTKAADKYAPEEMNRFKWYGSTLTKFDKFDFSIIPLIPQNANVLEVGCGNGRFAKKLHQNRKDIRYHGIDIVEKNIEFCNSLNLSGYRFTEKNYWKALAEGDFDFVVSIGVLFTTTDLPYMETLWELLDVKAKRGFLCMAIERDSCIFTKDWGLPKDMLNDRMAETIEHSIGFAASFIKDEKLPAKFNSLFYIVRDDTKAVCPEIPDVLLT